MKKEEIEEREERDEQVCLSSLCSPLFFALLPSCLSLAPFLLCASCCFDFSLTPHRDCLPSFIDWSPISPAVLLPASSTLAVTLLLDLIDRCTIFLVIYVPAPPFPAPSSLSTNRSLQHTFLVVLLAAYAVNRSLRK